MYLEEAGYRTETAKDGAEGLEKAKRLKPNIITLDMIMPVKDGWQVLIELKRHPIFKDIPIIIISITDEKKLGFSMGAVGYFVKPVNKEELLGAMKRIPLRLPKNKTQPKVLIIDDDRTASELIQVILEAEGYEVIRTENGKDGVRLAANPRPDHPGPDHAGHSGFNVAYQLKQQTASRNTLSSSSPPWTSTTKPGTDAGFISRS